jgi:spore germination cell wall hydrolase CwlJ-like protein
MKRRTPKMTVKAVVAGAVLVAAWAFQQAEIQSVHDDVQEIKNFIIKTDRRMNYTSSDLNCLAKNIYHEAGVESKQGKFAVAQVTLNRLQEGLWGRTICDVVYAPAQFSWTLYKSKRHEQPKGPLWEDSRAVARAVLDDGYRVPSLEAATYYHADYIKTPLWAKSVAKIQQVGQHIFYKKT